MFDFGNKKLIETLKQTIAKLTFENMEKDKTVDSLIGEINKLNNKIKELEYEKSEFYCECEETFFTIKDNNGNDVILYDTFGTKYEEISNKIKKTRASINGKDFTYFTVKKLNNEYCKFVGMNEIDNELKVITNNFLKSNEKYNNVFTYCGIPFRRMDDLYKIMNFLESENYVNHKKEYNYYEIDKLTKIKLVDNKIKITINGIDPNKFIELFNLKFNKNKLYTQKVIPTYNNKTIEKEKDIKIVIKKKMYSNFYKNLFKK